MRILWILKSLGRAYSSHNCEFKSPIRILRTKIIHFHWKCFCCTDFSGNFDEHEMPPEADWMKIVGKTVSIRRNWSKRKLWHCQIVHVYAFYVCETTATSNGTEIVIVHRRVSPLLLGNKIWAARNMQISMFSVLYATFFACIVPHYTNSHRLFIPFPVIQ